jgi:hypothetical protein
MRKIFLFAAIVLAFFLQPISGCKPEPIESKEENLRISTDASTYKEVPGPDFDLNLTVESAMPAAGVRIVTIVKGETDNSNYPQGASIETIANVTKIHVVNLPRQKFCICTVTVTSKSNNANIATASFRVVYK